MFRTLSQVSSSYIVHGWYVLVHYPSIFFQILTGRTEKADEVKGYIDWAVNHSFGVIDVNIPAILEARNRPMPFTSRIPTEDVQKQAAKLVGYLWDNYVEPSDAGNIFLMGVGNAFQGIVKLLCERGEIFHFCFVYFDTLSHVHIFCYQLAFSVCVLFSGSISLDNFLSLSSSLPRI